MHTMHVNNFVCLCAVQCAAGTFGGMAASTCLSCGALGRACPANRVS